MSRTLVNAFPARLMRRRARRVSVAYFVAGFIVPCTLTSFAHAMEAPSHAGPVPQLAALDTPAAQLQREREQRNAEARASDVLAPDARVAPAVSDSPIVLPDESPCYTIDRFVLSVPQSLPAHVRRAGASALPQDPFAFAAAWLDAYRGRCIGEQGAQRIIEGLGAQILARGYVTTRIQIERQSLSSGVVNVSLVPGLIRAIRFDDPRRRASWRTAFPVRPGDVLRLPDIEQALVQFKQVPGQDAYFRIEPTSEPAESDVVISLTRERPWRLTGIVDNGGVYSTGKVQGTLSLSVDNPLGINDRFNASLGHDLMIGQRGKGSQAWSAYYGMPYGFWFASLSAWGNDYTQRVAANRGMFATSGRSKVIEWQLARHLLRTHTSTLSLQFRLGKRFGRHFLEDYEIDTQRWNNTYAQWGIAERHYLGAAQIDTLLAWRQGLRWLGAQPNRAQDGTTWFYRMGLLDTNVSIPFGMGSRGFVYTTAFHGQWTADRLYAVDQLAIGTRWTVRGFDGEHLLSGERGYYWRNDLAIPLGQSGHALYVGADYGQVFGPSSAGLAGTRLAGAVIGVRGVAGRRASASRIAMTAAPAMTSGSVAGVAVDAQAGRRADASSANDAGHLSEPASTLANGEGSATHADSATSANPANSTNSATKGRLAAATGAAGDAMSAGSVSSWGGIPGVLTYDLYAGAPLWKPQGFPTAQITVGFQLAYQY